MHALLPSHLAQPRVTATEQQCFSLNPPTPSQMSIFFSVIVCFILRVTYLLFSVVGLKGKNALIKSLFSIIKVPNHILSLVIIPLLVSPHAISTAHTLFSNEDTCSRLCHRFQKHFWINSNCQTMWESEPMPSYNDCPCIMIFPFANLHPRSCDEKFTGGVQDI